MKTVGLIYSILISIAIVFFGWRLYSDKLMVSAPEHQAVTLLPLKEAPTWDATQAKTLAASQQALEEQLTAQAYLVMDVDSQTFLLQKNAATLLPPASTTKLMTALVVLAEYDLDEVVTVSKEIARDHDGGGLFAEEQITVRSLLIGTLVSSANDSAYALATHHPEGEKGFIERMNTYAQQWGLTQTRFANPTGYDDPPNISTARDLAILMLQVVKEPILLEWLGQEQSVVYNTTGSIRHFLYTTNQLLGYDPRVVAGKTGTTSLAKEVLIAISEHQGHRLLTVVMNSDDRYADTVQLMNWTAKHVQWQPGFDFLAL